MISENEAKKIADRYIAKSEQEFGEPLLLVSSDTLERPFGWVFFYNSKDYIETGDFQYMLAGNAPFIVDRNDGAIHVTGTAKPIEEYVAEYESQWKQQLNG